MPPTAHPAMDSPRSHSISFSEELCSISHHDNLNNLHLYQIFDPPLTPPTPTLLFLATIPLLKSSSGFCFDGQPKLRQFTCLFLRIKGIKRGIGDFRR